MKVLSISAIFTIFFTIFTGSAWGKLPPPTPEEEAKTAAAKQKSSEDAAKEKVLLEKAQDKVAQKFRSPHAKSSGASVDERTEVPSAALNSRPTEKAGAYNESVTPQSAAGASQGTRGQSANTPQEKSSR